jgi:hypothetical protein
MTAEFWGVFVYDKGWLKVEIWDSQASW